VTEDGRLLIHEEALACLAGIAALACPGVAGMAARGLQDGLADILGRDNPGRGVDVQLDDERCAVGLDLIVCYGARIAEVADDVVRRVRAVVEGTAGIAVERVEVRVQGVRRFPEPAAGPGADGAADA
jgi:uncharacterized alkaline shock family protein YloU